MNNKDADKPAHSHRLNAFVIRFLECVISKLVTSVITVFYLVSVVEETNLSLTISENPKTGFVMSRPSCCISRRGVNEHESRLTLGITIFKIFIWGGIA